MRAYHLGLGLSLLNMAVLGCGGSSGNPSGATHRDAAVHAHDGAILDARAGGDAATRRDAATSDASLSQCPVNQPSEGYDCYLNYAAGDRCRYADTTCICTNGGQNSAAWHCVKDDADAGSQACTYAGVEVADAGPRFTGSCPSTGCPAGTICAVEIGGTGGGGGEYCAPIPDRCLGQPTCACLGHCACGEFGGRPEACSDDPRNAQILCDNGIR